VPPDELLVDLTTTYIEATESPDDCGGIGSEGSCNYAIDNNQGDHGAPDPEPDATPCLGATSRTHAPRNVLAVAAKETGYPAPLFSVLIKTIMWTSVMAFPRGKAVV